MSFNRIGFASWQGSIKQGEGTISTESGALKGLPFGFKSRFDDEQNTNPEELIGAAHAGCFSMALSLGLQEANYIPTNINTEAVVSLDKDGDGFSITAVALKTTASVQEIDDETFQKIAQQTKEACPVSKVLNAEITLEATLES